MQRGPLGSNGGVSLPRDVTFGLCSTIPAMLDDCRAASSWVDCRMVAVGPEPLRARHDYQTKHTGHNGSPVSSATVPRYF